MFAEQYVGGAELGAQGVDPLLASPKGFGILVVWPIAIMECQRSLGVFFG